MCLPCCNPSQTQVKSHSRVTAPTRWGGSCAAPSPAPLFFLRVRFFSPPLLGRFILFLLFFFCPSSPPFAAPSLSSCPPVPPLPPFPCVPAGGALKGGRGDVLLLRLLPPIALGLLYHVHVLVSSCVPTVPVSFPLLPHCGLLLPLHVLRYRLPFPSSAQRVRRPLRPAYLSAVSHPLPPPGSLVSFVPVEVVYRPWSALSPLVLFVLLLSCLDFPVLPFSGRHY